MEGLDPNQMTDRELLLLTYEHAAGTSKAVAELGRRVSALEMWRTFLTGAGLTVAAGLAIMQHRVAQVLSDMLDRH